MKNTSVQVFFENTEFLESAYQILEQKSQEMTELLNQKLQSHSSLGYAKGKVITTEVGVSS